MTLHIYSQEQWHDSAYLVGTREGLEKLQAAIAKALEQGKATTILFVNDGEGYDLVVRLVDEITAGRLAVPYTNEMAAEKEGSQRVHPWQLAKLDPLGSDDEG